MSESNKDDRQAKTKATVHPLYMLEIVLCIENADYNGNFN